MPRKANNGLRISVDQNVVGNRVRPKHWNAAQTDAEIEPKLLSVTQI